MLDKKLVESACKKLLLKAVMESDIIAKKLTIDQHTELCEKVLEMKYNEVLPLLFGDSPVSVNEREQMRDYESKFKKGVKYAAAGYAGRKVGMRAIGGAPIKVLGKTLVKGAGGKGDIAGLATRKIGALGTKGGIKGALLGAGAYYLYRKLSDPCRAKAALSSGPQKNIVKHQCQAEAAKRVISQVTSQISKCDGTHNPAKCKAKLNKELVTWKKRLQQELVSLAQAKRSA